MSRVAQVRDAVQRQKLSLASQEARQQTERTEQADEQLRDTLAAIERTTSRTCVDLGRLSWIQDLASHADQALDTEKKKQDQVQQVLLETKREAQRKAHLRDRLAETEAAARMKESKEHDAHQVERAIEAWLGHRRKG